MVAPPDKLDVAHEGIRYLVAVWWSIAGPSGWSDTLVYAPVVEC
jgi:hypothetical protein